MNTIKANGLEWREIHSELLPLEPNTENFHSIQAGTLKFLCTVHFPDKAFVVAWLDYTVQIGTWEAKDFHFYNGNPWEEKYIQKLRMFNETQELFVWRTSTGLKGRLRCDDEQGAGIGVIVAHQVLFGTRKGNPCQGKFTEITEDRGTTLILPFTNLKFIKNDRQQEILRPRICVKTHNYLEPNPVGQMTYIDCRFVSFTDSNGRAL